MKVEQSCRAQPASATYPARKGYSNQFQIAHFLLGTLRRAGGHSLTRNRIAAVVTRFVGIGLVVTASFFSGILIAQQPGTAKPQPQLPNAPSAQKAKTQTQSTGPKDTGWPRTFISGA